MALKEDSLTIIPDDDVRMLMMAMMAGDTVQESIDNVLSSNAHWRAKLDAYFDLLLIPAEHPFRKLVLKVDHIKGLNETLQEVDLYFKLRMIAREKDLDKPVGAHKPKKT